MKIQKPIFKKYSKLLCFYTTMTVVIVCGFAFSKKTVSAYSHPADAAFYTKQRTYSVVFSDETFTRDISTNEVEMLTKELSITYNNTLKETEDSSNDELLEDFLPIGLPSDGIITSEFGTRDNPLGSGQQYHKGTDIALPIGTPVLANANGVVTMSRYSDSFGYVIEIQHIQGYSTIYAHNSQLEVEVGDYVLKGDEIALSGNSGNSTGPHLHYEVRLAEESVPPLAKETTLMANMNN